MKRTPLLCLAALSASVVCGVVPAQMAHGDAAMGSMEHKAAVTATSLTITGLDGTARTMSVAEMATLPQTNVVVTNSHTHAQENYSGVAVKDLLALVAPAKVVPVGGADAPMKSKVSSRMTVVIARGTDGFRVAMTLCDTDPGCRSGQAVVATSVDGHPLTTDGQFKLILTEDKTPGRWVRNLDALTVKNLGGM